MLFNPKWEKPSVEGFRTWLMQQPPGRQFPYYKCNECAVGQYLIACGTNWSELSAKDGDLLNTLNNFAFEATMAGNKSGSDYGRALWITAPMVLREMSDECVTG